jgi:hypothetical protein
VVASVPCWADGARSPTKIKGSWFVMKPATMVSGLSITGQARNLEKRGDTARLRAVRHAIALALPGLRVQERARREVLRRLAASRLRRLPVQRRPSCPRPLAPIAPSVVISQSCFVISWARRRWPHGSTRRTGDPLGSRRKGLPPLDPSLQYKSEIHSPSNARRVKTTRSMPLRFGAPDRARDERHGWAVVRGTQSREKEMHVFPSGTSALGPRGHRTYQPHRGIALRSRRMRSRRLNG